jgi:transcriptional regulator with XRE-family HTH domain
MLCKMTVTPLSIAILKNAFRHTLLEERNKHGLTQIELAKKSGLTRQCISLMESGQGSPTIFSLLRVAKALDMSITDFMYIIAKKAKLYGYDD